MDHADLIPALTAAGAVGLTVTNIDYGVSVATDRPGLVQLGVHRHGECPKDGLDAYDILLSSIETSAPWVTVPPVELDATIESLQAAVARQPVAASIAAQVLRMTPLLDFPKALLVESLAYSALLGSEPFRDWRTATPARQRAEGLRPRVSLEREAGVLHIRLTRPEVRNAVDALMRDALVEALEFALADPECADVVLSGEGPSFSAGGDLDEFGRADDPGRAHAIRVLRSATGAVHRIRERVTAQVHGACVGAGIEIAAAAGRVVACPDAFFRLPEVAMGLIPGAGGTVSLPRRIGRHRTCYMAIAGSDVDIPTALAWGLVDEIDAA